MADGKEKGKDVVNSPDPLADKVLERLFGPVKTPQPDEITSDEEILARFDTNPESVPPEDAAQALYRQLRRGL